MNGFEIQFLVQIINFNFNFIYKLQNNCCSLLKFKNDCTEEIAYNKKQLEKRLEQVRYSFTKLQRKEKGIKFYFYLKYKSSL